MATKSNYTSSLSPEYALLGLLYQRPAHGYELHQRLVTDLGQIWHISLSQAYNILNRLEAHGFITGNLLEQEKLPSRRQFRLTDPGRERFEAWLQAPTGCSVRAIRVEFTTRLYFANMIAKERAFSLIKSQIAETQGGIERLQKDLTSTPEDQTFNRLGLELRIKQLGSIIDWLSTCKRAIGIETGQTAVSARN
jgi:DNA-binding PadR family transcriptional regulator